MGFDVIPFGIWATIGVCAIAGVVGGAMTRARDNLAASALIGAIIGLSTATVLRLLDVYSPVYFDDYPVVWGALAAIVGAYVVSRTTT